MLRLIKGFAVITRSTFQNFTLTSPSSIMTSTAGTYRLPPNAAPSSSGSDTDDLDDGCSDWASSFGEARRTKSLFDDTVHASPELAMKHDASLHRFDLDAVCKDRELDMYGRIRLVNLIRRDVSEFVAELIPGLVSGSGVHFRQRVDDG